MIKTVKRFMNKHVWFRKSLAMNESCKKAFVLELQKCKGRAFTGNSWTDEEYNKFEILLNEKIKELDDLTIRSINHGV